MQAHDPRNRPSDFSQSLLQQEQGISKMRYTKGKT
jgi:hypothetical protein